MAPATLAAEKTDLTEKLLQAPAKEEIQASTTKEETKEEENKKETIQTNKRSRRNKHEM